MIAHATEDPEKVREALMNILPERAREDAAISCRHMKGHHGNPILLYVASISKPRALRALVDELSAKLDELDKRVLSNELISQFDEDGNLYIRLDKQAAFGNRVQLTQGDPIRLKLKFVGRVVSPEAIKQSCEEWGVLR